MNPPSHSPLTPDMLASIGLFGGFSEEMLALLARALRCTHTEPGTIVVREGDAAKQMYLVLGGELEIMKRTKGDSDVRVALIGPGDWFGEVALLGIQPRTATVRTVAPTTLVEITAADVDRLLYRHDMKAYALLLTNIARELSRRLQVADGILAQLIASYRPWAC